MGVQPYPAPTASAAAPPAERQFSTGINGIYPKVGSWFPTTSGYQVAALSIPTGTRPELRPWWSPHTMTIDRVAVWVTASSASSSIRVGFYNAATTRPFLPTTLMNGDVTLDTTVTGMREAAWSVSFTQGTLYWLLMCADTTALPSINCCDTDWVFPQIGMANNSDISTYAGITYRGAVSSRTVSTPLVNDPMTAYSMVPNAGSDTPAHAILYYRIGSFT